MNDKELIPCDSDNTYNCHICAIEVPAAFAREHAASVKHRANARIATVAVQRTRELISSLPPPIAKKPTSRFCTNCAIIVDDERSHNHTKEHRFAVIHDNLLWQLMHTYTGNDDEPIESDDNKTNDELANKKTEGKYVDIDLKHGYNNMGDNDIIVAQAIDKNQLIIEAEEGFNKGTQTDEHIDINDRNIKECNEDVEWTMKTTEETVNRSRNDFVRCLPSRSQLEHSKTIEVHRNWVTKEIKSIDHKVTHFSDDYGKQLLQFVDTDDLYELKELNKKVHIKMIDKNEDKIIVDSDYFHSYRRIYDSNLVNCMVCNWAFNDIYAEAHKWDLNHMNHVAEIGSNGHYVRQISHTYSHCILCNWIVKNKDLVKHRETQHHIEKKTCCSNNIEETNEQDYENQIDDEETHNDNASINEQVTCAMDGRISTNICDKTNPEDRYDGPGKDDTETLNGEAYINGQGKINAHNYTNITEDTKHDDAMQENDYESEHDNSQNANSTINNSEVNNKLDYLIEINHSKAQHNDTALNVQDKATETSNIGSEIKYPFKEVTGLSAVFKVKCIVCDCTVLRSLSSRMEHINGYRHKYAIANTKRTTTLLNPANNNKLQHYEINEQNMGEIESYSNTSAEEMNEDEYANDMHGDEQEVSEQDIEEVETYRNTGAEESIEEEYATDMDGDDQEINEQDDYEAQNYNLETNDPDTSDIDEHNSTTNEEDSEIEIDDSEAQNINTAANKGNSARETKRTDSKIKHTFKENTDNTGFLCTVCNCTVPRSVRNIVEHINGLRHRIEMNKKK